jgi:hypothetical protein
MQLSLRRSFGSVKIVYVDNQAIQDNALDPIPNADVYVIAPSHSGADLRITFDRTPNCSNDDECPRDFNGETVSIEPLLNAIRIANQTPRRLHFASCEMAKDLDEFRALLHRCGIRCIATAYEDTIGWSRYEFVYLSHSLPLPSKRPSHRWDRSGCQCIRSHLRQVDTRDRY